MNLANAIISSMRMNVYYRACDIEIVGKNISTQEKKHVLDMLVRGGIVEAVNGDGYRRKKLYQTRQPRLL